MGKCVPPPPPSWEELKYGLEREKIKIRIHKRTCDIQTWMKYQDNDCVD